MDFLQRKKKGKGVGPEHAQRKAEQEELTHQFHKSLKCLQQKEHVDGAPIVSNESSNNLCSVLEAVFLHGIKDGVVSKLVSYAQRSNNNTAEVTKNFWPVIKKFTHNDVITQLKELSQITSDIGLCRAWVRLTINDGLMASYLASMTADTKALRTFYHPWAYLLDFEQPEILRNHLTGLMGLNFNLSCNSSILNLWSSSTITLAGLAMETLAPPPVIIGPCSPSHSATPSPSSSRRNSASSIHSLAGGAGEENTDLSGTTTTVFSEAESMTSAPSTVTHVRITTTPPNTPASSLVFSNIEEVENLKRLVGGLRSESVSSGSSSVASSCPDPSEPAFTVDDHLSARSSRSNSPFDKIAGHMHPAETASAYHKVSREDRKLEEQAKLKAILSRLDRKEQEREEAENEHKRREKGQEKGGPGKQAHDERERTSDEKQRKAQEQYRKWVSEKEERNALKKQEEEERSKRGAKAESLRTVEKLSQAELRANELAAGVSSKRGELLHKADKRKTPTTTSALETSTSALPAQASCPALHHPPSVDAASVRSSHSTQSSDVVVRSVGAHKSHHSAHHDRSLASPSSLGSAVTTQSTAASSSSPAKGSHSSHAAAHKIAENSLQAVPGQSRSNHDVGGVAPLVSATDNANMSIDDSISTVDTERPDVNSQVLSERRGSNFGNSLSGMDSWTTACPDFPSADPPLEQSYESLLKGYQAQNGNSARMASVQEIIVDLPAAEDVSQTKPFGEHVSKAYDALDIVEDESDFDDYEIIPSSAEAADRERLEQLKVLCAFSGRNAQGNKCASPRCNVGVGFFHGPGVVCNFDGKTYCESCHRSDLTYIPAEIVYNWNFKKKKVSVDNFSFLQRMQDQPVIDLEVMSTHIYKAVPAMATIRQLRTKLISLRSYMFTCSESTAHQLRDKVWPREHLYNQVHTYTVNDFVEVRSGKLELFLRELVDLCTKHVYSCSLCSAKGFYCELCRDLTPIFPFELDTTVKCDTCRNVYHRKCKSEKTACPKCWRLSQRGVRLPDDDYACSPERY